MTDLERFLQEWNDDEPTVLVHTSGSTGKPKPMRVEKKRMLASARITCDFLGLKPNDTALLCMPLDYIAGKMVVVRAIERGLKLIERKPSGHPLADIDQHIDFAAMVPLQVYNSLQVVEECERLKSINNLIIGGGAIDDAMAEQLHTFPNAVWSTYGMTETLSHIALRRISGSEASEWYEPFTSVNVSLSADGCLVIDAPLVCNEPLTTHDRAEIAADGRHFRILGRKDNVIDTGGIKVQIEEVERTLRPHLSMPFMITKRQDKKFGEAIVLLVESVSTDIEVIKNVCVANLPRYWQPKHIISIEHLPMTATGKPARAEAERLAMNK
jgi:O-succinylbenzoic acid--CoA ligase